MRRVWLENSNWRTTRNQIVHHDIVPLNARLTGDPILEAIEIQIWRLIPVQTPPPSPEKGTISDCKCTHDFVYAFLQLQEIKILEWQAENLIVYRNTSVTN